MSSALWPALLVLQMFCVYGASLVLNGKTGDSILLPTGREVPVNGTGMVQWRKNDQVVIKLRRKLEGLSNSTFEITKTNQNFTGRLIVNNKTGSLNISRLREEDSGQYIFNGLISGVSLLTDIIHLQVYGNIVSVQVTSQVNNGTDSDSCNVTLRCIVNGSHQVVLSWTKDGYDMPGTENRTTLTVYPVLAEEIYTCTAKNPASSRSSAVKARSCRPPGISSSLLIYIATGGACLSFLLVIVVSAVVIARRKSKTVEEHEETTVYAAIGDDIPAQKGSVCSQPPLPAEVSTCYDVIKVKGRPAQPTTVYDVLNFEQSKTQQYQKVL